MKKKKNSVSGGLPSKAPWYLHLRFSVFVLLSGVIVLFLKVPNFIIFPFVIYSFFTLSFLLILFLNQRLHWSFLLKSVVALQILLELLLEGGVIQATGGFDSRLSLFFILTIVSSSLLFRLAGTLVVASLASIIYAFSVLNGAETDSFIFSSFNFYKSLSYLNDKSFYGIFLYLCAFFLIAFIAGYLAQKLKIKGEELLTASQELSRIKTDTDDILKHMRSGLITVDNLGRVVYFNRTASEILGMAEKDVKGKHFLEIFQKNMPELSSKLYQALEANTIDSRSEILITNHFGKKIPLGINTSILGGEKTGKRGIIAVFQDITEAKKLEEKVRIGDRLAAVGELSAGIAHEIRNPLASISGAVEVLKEELSLSGENQKLMELIIKESGRLNSILTEFLHYARIKPTLLSKVEIVHIINDVIEIVKKHPSYNEKIIIKKGINPPPLYVLGEENQIKQVFLNLMVNALEAIGNNRGEVIILNKSLNEIEEHYFSEEEDKEKEIWIPLAIKDTGKGMTEEQKEKIFQPFCSTKRNGTGLGLAIVQRLVNSFNGKIEFKSSLGQGTIFVIYFQKYKMSKDAMLSQPILTLSTAK